MADFFEQLKDRSPFDIFDKWYKEAETSSEVVDHTEMCVATANKQGCPSARILLLKGWDERGFKFFTNYEGRKSHELDENPNAAICFYWNPLGRQIRIEGSVEKTTKQESDEYFASRRRESRLGAITSKQSRELESYKKFQQELEETTQKFEGQDVPRPENWGGWRLKPNRIEFWQAGDFRLHHRIVFERNSDGSWNSKELYP